MILAGALGVARRRPDLRNLVSPDRGTLIN
jgi:hypothetical protein